MKKKECPSCAVEIDSDLEICPICGYEFPQQSLALKVAAWIMILLVLSWILF